MQLEADRAYGRSGEQAKAGEVTSGVPLGSDM